MPPWTRHVSCCLSILNVCGIKEKKRLEGQPKRHKLCAPDSHMALCLSHLASIASSNLELPQSNNVFSPSCRYHGVEIVGYVLEAPWDLDSYWLIDRSVVDSVQGRFTSCKLNPWIKGNEAEGLRYILRKYCPFFWRKCRFDLYRKGSSSRHKHRTPLVKLDTIVSRFVFLSFLRPLLLLIDWSICTRSIYLL